MSAPLIWFGVGSLTVFFLVLWSGVRRLIPVGSPIPHEDFGSIPAHVAFECTARIVSLDRIQLRDGKQALHVVVRTAHSVGGGYLWPSLMQGTPPLRVGMQVRLWARLRESVTGTHRLLEFDRVLPAPQDCPMSKEILAWNV